MPEVVQNSTIAIQTGISVGFLFFSVEARFPSRQLISTRTTNAPLWLRYFVLRRPV
jgi:hypothetical protein